MVSWGIELVRAREGRVIWSEKEICGDGGRWRRKPWSEREIEIGVIMVRRRVSRGRRGRGSIEEGKTNGHFPLFDLGVSRRPIL